MPVDHEMFEDITTSQWLWYYNNFVEDNKESFEHDRDMVEYLASFMEPEAVRKIREAREKSVVIPDEEFFAGIEYTFGRKVNLSKERKETGVHKSDPVAAIQSFKQNKTTNPVTIDSKHWLGIELE